VKGVDSRALENFASFCDQDYPHFDLLFGVADLDDPAAKLIEQLAAQRSDRKIRLIVAPTTSANPKSSTLQRLTDEATGELLVISDADIRVTPDYLARVVAPLSDPAIGIVTCLYRGANAKTLPAKLEALHMSATFLPSVVLAHELLGQCVGMGATLALRKLDVQRIGGYESFRDHLMDDYQLAERVQKLGLKIGLSDYVVESVLGDTRFADQWAREVRWARGIRITTPAKYPGLLLTYPMVLSLILVALHPLSWFAWGAVGISIIVRIIIAASISSLITPGTSEAKTRIPLRDSYNLLLLPIREILSFAVWCGGLFGRTIVWRGQRFLLRKDGTLAQRTAPPSRDAPGERWGRGSSKAASLAKTPTLTLPRSTGRGKDGNRGTGAESVTQRQGRGDRAAAFDRIVRRLDAFLRRRQGIFEFSDAADCLFRISIGACEEPIALADGTMVGPGQKIGDLHLWNEHLPQMSADGPSLAWAHEAMLKAQKSLAMLAQTPEKDERLKGIQVFRARSNVTPRGGVRMLQRLAERMHCELREPPQHGGLGTKLHDLGENLLVWALVRTFNPGGLRGAKLMRKRSEFWISRKELMMKYGGVNAE
jgi:ceramide glucosyltransferase